MLKDSRKRIGARALKLLEDKEVKQNLSEVNNKTKRKITALLDENVEKNTENTEKDLILKKIQNNLKKIEDIDSDMKLSKQLIDEAYYQEQEEEIQKLSKLVIIKKEK